MIHGKDLILSDSQTGSGHFACATSCTVSTKSDFIEVAHPTEGGWKRYKPTILSWSASTGHLLASYANYKYFRNMQESKQAVTIRFYDAELQIFYKGEAFIETLELTGDVRGFAKMKVSLQPSGPLTAATETAWRIENEYSNSTRRLSWDYNTKRVTILEIADGDEDMYKGVVFIPFTLSAIKNRITVRPKRALLQCTEQLLKTWIRNKNNYPFNNAMLVFPPEDESASVIVGPGDYGVVVNIEDQDSLDTDFWVMSSF